ncbi:MAG: S24 family peptidase [Erysipelotrichaceae bacterium]|nr:S24 family peptidase [Erysipelotrichaceae bacterium]
MKFKENLRFLRRSNHMSQNELADLLGYKSFTTVQKWEDGTTFPVVENLNRLAQIFNVDLDHLLNVDLTNDNVEVPILGEVKAGYNLYVNQEIMGYEYMSNHEYKPGEYFYLKVKGDSMVDERICEGDIVYVRKQDYINDNEIGVFLLDNNEVTIKRFRVMKNGPVLRAGNKNYADVKLKEGEYKVLGKVLHSKIMF